MLEAAWNTELDSLDVNSLENLTYRKLISCFIPHGLTYPYSAR